MTFIGPRGLPYASQQPSAQCKRMRNAHPYKMDTAQVPNLRDAVVCVHYRTERQFKDWHQAIVGADDLHRPEGSTVCTGATVSGAGEYGTSAGFAKRPETSPFHIVFQPLSW